MHPISRWTVLAAVFAAVSCSPIPSRAQASAANSHATNTLHIETSTAPVFLGKATLTVGALHHSKGTYAGNYDVQVTPLTVASEKGDLSATFSDDELRKLGQKTAVSFHGKATSTSGKSRTVEGRATPTASDHGDITIKIFSERGKLVFHTTYRFAAQ